MLKHEHRQVSSHGNPREKFFEVMGVQDETCRCDAPSSPFGKNEPRTLGAQMWKKTPIF